MTKNFNTLRTKIGFKVKQVFFIIFKAFSVAKNCLRSASVSKVTYLNNCLGFFADFHSSFSDFFLYIPFMKISFTADGFKWTYLNVGCLNKRNMNKVKMLFL